MSNDGTISDEDRAAIGHAWRELIEDRAHNGKLQFFDAERARDGVTRLVPPSPRCGQQVGGWRPQGRGRSGPPNVWSRGRPEDPTIVHGDVVRIIGNGSVAAGRRVLEKFVQRVRRQSATTPFPAGRQSWTRVCPAPGKHLPAR